MTKAAANRLCTERTTIGLAPGASAGAWGLAFSRSSASALRWARDSLCTGVTVPVANTLIAALDIVPDSILLMNS